jgi:hypothetical protein
MAAGAFAGVAEHSVMYPIDLLKVRWDMRLEDEDDMLTLRLSRHECKS